MADNVNHPPHYNGFTNGSEVIDIAEHLNYNGGNIVKYAARACRTDGNNKGERLEDMRKCVFYAQREVERLKKEMGL